MKSSAIPAALDGQGIDRRARRSRKALQEAAVLLLQSNQLSEITVGAVAAEADVNRRTFYAHFQSIEELLESKIFEELSAVEHDLSDAVLAFPFNYDELLSVLIRHVEQQGENLELLVNTGAVQVMNTALEKMIRNLFDKALRVNGLSGTDNVMMDYIANFAVGACIGLLNKWISRGRQESASEVVAISVNIFKPLFEQGLRSAGFDA